MNKFKIIYESIYYLTRNINNADCYRVINLKNNHTYAKRFRSIGDAKLFIKQKLKGNK